MPGMACGGGGTEAGCSLPGIACGGGGTGRSPGGGAAAAAESRRNRPEDGSGCAPLPRPLRKPADMTKPSARFPMRRAVYWGYLA